MDVCKSDEDTTYHYLVCGQRDAGSLRAFLKQNNRMNNVALLEGFSDFASLWNAGHIAPGLTTLRLYENGNPITNKIYSVVGMRDSEVLLEESYPYDIPSERKNRKLVKTRKLLSLSGIFWSAEGLVPNKN